MLQYYIPKRLLAIASILSTCIVFVVISLKCTKYTTSCSSHSIWQQGSQASENTLYTNVPIRYNLCLIFHASDSRTVVYHLLTERTISTSWNILEYAQDLTAFRTLKSSCRGLPWGAVGVHVRYPSAPVDFTEFSAVRPPGKLHRAVMKRSWHPSKFCIYQFIPYTIIASRHLISVPKLSIFYRTPYVRHPNGVWLVKSLLHRYQSIMLYQSYTYFQMPWHIPTYHCEYW